MRSDLEIVEWGFVFLTVPQELVLIDVDASERLAESEMLLRALGRQLAYTQREEKRKREKREKDRIRTQSRR